MNSADIYCSKAIVETLEKDVKNNDVILVFLWLAFYAFF